MHDSPVHDLLCIWEFFYSRNKQNSFEKKIIYLNTKDIKVKRKNIQTNSLLNMFLQFAIKSITCSCTIPISFIKGRFTIQNKNSIYNVNSSLNQISTINSGHPKSKDLLASYKRNITESIEYYKKCLCRVRFTTKVSEYSIFYDNQMKTWYRHSKMF